MSVSAASHCTYVWGEFQCGSIWFALHACLWKYRLSQYMCRIAGLFVDMSVCQYTCRIAGIVVEMSVCQYQLYHIARLSVRNVSVSVSAGLFVEIPVCQYPCHIALQLCLWKRQRVSVCLPLDCLFVVSVCEYISHIAGVLVEISVLEYVSHTGLLICCSLSVSLLRSHRPVCLSVALSFPNHRHSTLCVCGPRSCCGHPIIC